MAGKIILLAKYLDYAHLFSKKSVVELLKRFDIKKYTINLEKSGQLPCQLTYNLGLMRLKTLETYNEINLANDLFAVTIISAFWRTTIFVDWKIENTYLQIEKVTFAGSWATFPWYLVIDGHVSCWWLQYSVSHSYDNDSQIDNSL